MADQGFRPFSSLSSAPSMAQQHVNSSVNATSIQMLPSHPQYAMAYQGFRPLSPLLSAPSMAQQHVNSSVNAASIQMPTLPSHIDVSNIDLDVSNIDPSDDGYNWRMCGQMAVQGKWYPVIYYECTQANCGVQKSVARSADGLNTETLCRGRHNHSRPSERWLTDASVRLEPGSQDCVLIEDSDAAGTAGPSMPTRAEGAEQSSGSSDGEEDDDGEVRVNGDAAGDAIANSIERHVSAPAPGITVQPASEVDVLGNGCRRSQRSEKGRTPSLVWDDFTRVLIDGNVERATCNHCKKCLSANSKSGTSHLSRHLEICPARPGTSRVRQKRSCPQPDLSVAKNSKFGHENSLEELTRAIVLNLWPFSVMYSASFPQFLAGRNPAFNMVATVEEKFLSVFQNEKSKLKEKITVAPGGVFLSLTKSKVDNSVYDDVEARFICLTVHFIDEDWKINRRIITCTYSGIEVIVGSHNILPDWQRYETPNGSDAADRVLEEAVRDWSLEKKLLGVTLEQSVYKYVILDLEDKLTGRNYLLARCKLLDIPCMVGELHNLLDSENSFVKEITRTWSNYVGSSPERKQKYEEVLRQMHLNHPSLLSKDWYLAFYLLETVLQFIKSFPDAELPSFEELEATKSYCNIARPVHEAIKVVSDPHNATSNSYFHVLWSVRKALQESSSMKNIEKIFDIANMLGKFDNNWNKWHSWLSVAVVLDPRYKLSYVESCYTQASSLDAGMYTSEVRAKLYELYIRYSYVNEQSSENNDLQSDIQISFPLHNWSQNYNTQAAVEEFKELHGYLGEGLCPQNDAFDILKWWKSNSSTYPTLAKMARDILAIPGCAVSGESAFDIRDERADLLNRKLRPEIIEAIICAHNWIRSSGTSDADDGNNNVLV